MSELYTELRKAAEQDGPDGLPWKAADRIAELEERCKGAEELAHLEHKNMLAYRNRRIALVDGLRPIATEMIEPECPEDEVDDCETCQCFIDWGNRILALIDKEPAPPPATDDGVKP